MWFTQNAVCSQTSKERNRKERRVEGVTESLLERVGTQAGRTENYINQVTPKDHGLLTKWTSVLPNYSSVKLSNPSYI